MHFSDSAPHQEGVGANVKECFLGVQWHFARQLRMWGGAQVLWRMRSLVLRMLLKNRDNMYELVCPQGRKKSWLRQTFTQWAGGCRTAFILTEGLGYSGHVVDINCIAQEPFSLRSNIQTFFWGTAHISLHPQLQQWACDLFRPIPLALEIDSGRSPLPAWLVNISSRTFGGVPHGILSFLLAWLRV